MHGQHGIGVQPSGRVAVAFVRSCWHLTKRLARRARLAGDRRAFRAINLARHEGVSLECCIGGCGKSRRITPSVFHDSVYLPNRAKRDRYPMVKKPSHSDNGFCSRTPLYRNTQFLPGNDPIVSAQEMRWKTQVRTINRVVNCSRRGIEMITPWRTRVCYDHSDAKEVSHWAHEQILRSAPLAPIVHGYLVMASPTAPARPPSGLRSRYAPRARSGTARVFG
jgi:hypothetical protein